MYICTYLCIWFASMWFATCQKFRRLQQRRLGNFPGPLRTSPCRRVRSPPQTILRARYRSIRSTTHDNWVLAIPLPPSPSLPPSLPLSLSRSLSLSFVLSLSLFLSVYRIHIIACRLSGTIAPPSRFKHL